MFFSSHILSDAETLCSRVAVVARGRLVATGALSEMLAFRSRGWEVVVEGLGESLAAAMSPAPIRVQPIGAGRATLEFQADLDPARIVAAVASSGATLVSITPLRESLEDFFVKQVAGADWGRMG